MVVMVPLADRLEEPPFRLPSCLRAHNFPAIRGPRPHFLPVAFIAVLIAGGADPNSGEFVHFRLPERRFNGR
jgi:hypothetical protein